MSDSGIPLSVVLRSKYEGEQDDRHGGELQWPGIHGIPVRGSEHRLTKKGEEFDAILVGDFHCRVFDLNDEEERRYFCWIRERVYNGWFALVKQEYKFHDDKPYPTVYLEWCQHYYQWSKRNDVLGQPG